ncbi:MAG: F0F1 ATP synthase subunit B [Acidimicrobiaceae bacterium]|nr:F0F1 ATP synthase subunit B [Acidimicrobiaceae bacterium]
MSTLLFAASQSSNPILPASGEIIWSVLSFFVLLLILAKVAFPPVAKMMKDRSEKIRTDIEAGELARSEAEQMKAQAREHLEDARRESSRLVDEARKTAEAVKAELVANAEAEVASMKVRAEEALDVERTRLVSELREATAELALSLAERILAEQLDRASFDPLITAFLAESEASSK